jgi:hypothetical protein
MSRRSEHEGSRVRLRGQFLSGLPVSRAAGGCQRVAAFRLAEMLPESVLNEDEQLQMIYDTAVTRTGGAD